jgi:hypothetical protein
LMRWNGNLMELLNISFSPFLHLWTSSLIDKDSSIHRGIWRCWWFILQLSLGMTSLFIIRTLSTWLVKIGPSPDMYLF